MDVSQTTNNMKKQTKKVRTIKAWADVGSHGHIYHFIAGPVAERYPKLMHVFSEKVSPHLKRVTITYNL